MVPTLTEVLDAADLQFPGNGNGNGNGNGTWASDAAAGFDAVPPLFGTAAESETVAGEPVLIDAALRQSIAAAVDAAVADLRARLLPQVEALIQQALVMRSKNTND